MGSRFATVEEWDKASLGGTHVGWRGQHRGDVLSLVADLRGEGEGLEGMSGMWWWWIDRLWEGQQA